MCVVPGTWPAGLASHVHENYTQVWLHTNHSTVGSDSRPTSMTGHSMAPPHHYCALWYTVLTGYCSRTTDMHSLRLSLLPSGDGRPCTELWARVTLSKGKGEGITSFPTPRSSSKRGLTSMPRTRWGAWGRARLESNVQTNTLWGRHPVKETHADGEVDVLSCGTMQLQFAVATCDCVTEGQNPTARGEHVWSGGGGTAAAGAGGGRGRTGRGET